MNLHQSRWNWTPPAHPSSWFSLLSSLTKTNKLSLSSRKMTHNSISVDRRICNMLTLLACWAESTFSHLLVRRWKLLLMLFLLSKLRDGKAQGQNKSCQSDLSRCSGLICFQKSLKEVKIWIHHWYLSDMVGRRAAGKPNSPMGCPRQLRLVAASARPWSDCVSAELHSGWELPLSAPFFDRTRFAWNPVFTDRTARMPNFGEEEKATRKSPI